MHESIRIVAKVNVATLAVLTHLLLRLLETVRRAIVFPTDSRTQSPLSKAARNCAKPRIGARFGRSIQLPGH
jgi:hypothetical protein